MKNYYSTYIAFALVIQLLSVINLESEDYTTPVSAEINAPLISLRATSKRNTLNDVLTKGLRFYNQNQPPSRHLTIKESPDRFITIYDLPSNNLKRVALVNVVIPILSLMGDPTFSNSFLHDQPVLNENVGVSLVDVSLSEFLHIATKQAGAGFEIKENQVSVFRQYTLLIRALDFSRFSLKGFSVEEVIPLLVDIPYHYDEKSHLLLYGTLTYEIGETGEYSDVIRESFLFALEK